MRHLPYFSVAFSGGEGHLDAREKRQGGGNAPHAVHMQSEDIDLSPRRGFQSNINHL